MGAVNQESQNGAESTQSHAEAVAQRISTAFRESPYRDLRGLECDSSQGELTVRGRVPSFYLKQLALFTVQRIDGATPVNILIEVE